MGTFSTKNGGDANESATIFFFGISFLCSPFLSFLFSHSVFIPMFYTQNDSRFLERSLSSPTWPTISWG